MQTQTQTQTQIMMEEIVENKSIRHVTDDEVKFKVTETLDKFLVSGHFIPLDIRAAISVRKVEPKLVSETQFKNSEEFSNAKSVVVQKVNSKMFEIKKIIERRSI